MLNKIAVLVVSLLTTASFAVDLGIPYALDCAGKSDAGVKIELKTAGNGDDLDLVRTYKPSPTIKTKAPTQFKIEKIGTVKGGIFEVKSVGRVMFAGGGSLTGDLSFSTESKKGVWTETISTFDESKGIPVKHSTKYAVTCSLAQ